MSDWEREREDEGRSPAPGGTSALWWLPGAALLGAGRWHLGVPVLGVWSIALVTLLARARAIPDIWFAGVDGKLAVLTLGAALGGLLLWSWSDPTGRRMRVGARWHSTVRAFQRNRLAVLGGWVVILAYLLALLAPLIAPFDPAAQGDLVGMRLAPPSSTHLLGTDHFARDIFSRMLYGARVSLSIGFIAVAISASLGTLVGTVAGYLGGWVDVVLMRTVDVVISFPRLILLITIIALFQPSIFLIVVVLGLTQWPGTARLVRGEVLSLREREFIQAAEALGFSRARIMARHLVPNALVPVIIAATLGIGNTIVLEAGLSFLGLGVQPPTPSWGTMVADGRNFLTRAWWLSTFPGLAIVGVVLAFNLVGDGLRDALDPRMRKG
ncbi:MAG: ABC transporter permease [Longimicrobiales bacterium]|nr:ABC transporter permease [Longimicrobiales bacterium]